MRRKALGLACGAALVAVALTAPAQAQIRAGLVNLASMVTGTLPFGNGGTGLAAASDDTTLVSSGSAWQAKALPSCSNTTTSKLLYDQSTNAWSCGTDQTGSTNAAGSDTQVQFNDGGTAFGGDAGLTYNKTTDTLTVLGSIVTGSGSGVAGTVDLTQGTLPSSFPSNSFSLYAPTSISTSYQWRLPTADAAGAIVSSGAGTPGVLSIVGFSGTGNIAKVTAPTFAGLTSTTTLTSTIGTVTASTPALSITETRNSSGVTFQGITYALTNTAAASASTMLDLQTGSAASRLAFFPNAAGFSIAENSGLLYAGAFQTARVAVSGGGTLPVGLIQSSTSVVGWGSGLIKYDGTLDSGISRNAAGLIEANTGTPGTIRDFKARNYVTTVGSNIASAGTIAPTAGITHITGTATVSTITVPTNLAVASSGGCLTLIPDGVFATDTAGNIALATTAVVGKALRMCYDHGQTKWYPSY